MITAARKEEVKISTNDLQILIKIEKLDQYTRIALRQFPKYEKFILAADIRQTIIDIKRNTIRAGKKYHKKTTLQDLDIDIEILRTYIRESYAMHYIDEHKLGVWMDHVDEIGRMVGGWLKNQ